MGNRETHVDRDGEITTEGVVGTFVNAWALMTGRYAGASQQRGGGVAATFSQTVCPFLNMATLDQSLTDPGAVAAAIDVARGHASRCPHGSMVAICGDWAPADWQVIAADAGLAAGMTITGMATDSFSSPRHPEPALDFRLIEDVATGHDLGVVNALAYGMPPELFAPTAEPALWQGHSFGFVGYDGSNAVTASAAFATDEMIYIAFVASLPGLQGRGYAEGTMRRAIAAAEQAVGPKRLWLHASDRGHLLYGSMGFEAGAVLQTWQFA